MKRQMTMAVGLWAVSVCGMAQAETSYWKDSGTGNGDFTNSTLWVNGTVPGTGDTASFTNAIKDPAVSWSADTATAAASFSLLNKSATLNINTSAWRVSELFAVAPDANRTSTVSLASGSLIVTNASGSALFSVGMGAKGTFNMNGSLHVDQLAAGSGAVLNLKAGELLTYHGATATNAAFTVGATVGKTMTWSMLGGVNLLTAGSLSIGVNVGQPGIVNVSNAGTLFTNFPNLVVGGNSTGNGRLCISNQAVAVSGAGSTLTVGGYGSLLKVASGGAMTLFGTMGVGGAASDTNNSAEVTGPGSILTVPNTVTIGSSGYSNQLIVADGGTLMGGGANELRAGYSLTGKEISNRITVRGAGSVVTNFGIITVGQQNGGNRFEVRDGGQVFNLNAQMKIGNNAPATNNTVLVDGAGSAWWAQTISLAGGDGNRLSITNGGRVVASVSCTVGSATVGGDSVWISDSGLLDTGGTLTTGAAANNTAICSGGVLQFTSATPAVNPNGFGRIAITNGTVSFRNVTAADVKCNLSGKSLDGATKVAWSGVNAFRLNNSVNGAAGSQTYVFDAGMGYAPTNFAGLELVDGITAYTNGSVTVGSAGWLTFTNTTATMWGAVMSAGRLTVVDSTVTFKSNLILGENCTINWSSNRLASAVVVNGTLKVPAAASLTVSIPLAKTDQIILFTSATAIDGSAKGWSVTPDTHHVVTAADGKQLVLVARAPTGTLIQIL